MVTLFQLQHCRYGNEHKDRSICWALKKPSGIFRGEEGTSESRDPI